MEPASPREKDGDVVWVLNPGVAALIGFAAQTKLIRFESARASAIHTPPLFGLTPGDATGTPGVVITSPFIGPFCMSVGMPTYWHPWPHVRRSCANLFPLTL